MTNISMGNGSFYVLPMLLMHSVAHHEPITLVESFFLEIGMSLAIALLSGGINSSLCAMHTFILPLVVLYH